MNVPFRLNSDNLFILYEELRDEHTRVLAYENAISLYQASGISMSGDYKHRPLGFYTEKSTNILNHWTVLHSELDRTLDQINLRRIETVQRFEKATILPTEFLVIADEYILLSHFLIKKK